jgi:hypothetical protein
VTFGRDANARFLYPVRKLRDTWSRRDLPARSGHTDHPFCALRSHDGQAAIGVHATYFR